MDNKSDAVPNLMTAEMQAAVTTLATGAFTASRETESPRVSARLRAVMHLAIACGDLLKGENLGAINADVAIANRSISELRPPVEPVAPKA